MAALCLGNIVPGKVKHTKRKYKTWKFATEFLIRKNVTKDQAELGRWTRDRLVDLGPTFIKLGQIASARSDLYPPEFIKQLETLQDDVPPINDVMSCIDVSKFEKFDPVPYKSASIGQVHKARLLDGTDVVVKVKRPGIYEIMKEDTDTIMKIVDFLEKIGVDTGTSTNYVLKESVEYLLAETDYMRETNDAIMFKRAMREVDWIRVPGVYKSMCTNEMIVMEYVYSTKLTEIPDPNVNRKKICEALINSYLIQTMEKGFFHADPHPGNLGFSEDGKLVFYDFGLVIPLSKELTDGFKDLFVCIVDRDTKGIVEILIKLGVITPTTTDLGDIELFFKTTLNYLETLDGKSVKDDILNDDILISLAQKKPFIIPTSFVYLAKAFSTIEGTCVALDPMFTYYEYLEPMLQETVEEAIDVKKMLTTAVEMPGRIREINSAVLNLEKSRTTMKRSMEKTRREVKSAQYTVLSTIFATSMIEHGYMHECFVFIFAVILFTVRKNR
jgi:predicted unusual protein kinase regulating ubiquinone biosynthesis (AarF/ABC1/UbiB family)